MTASTYKFHLVVPAADCKAVNAWIRTTIDPGGADWLTPTLSATGREPFTHAQCCFHATPEQAERWATRLKRYTPALGVEGFTAKARATQEGELLAYKPALRAGTGMALSMAFNDAGEQPDPAGTLLGLGLKRAVALADAAAAPDPLPQKGPA